MLKVNFYLSHNPNQHQGQPGQPPGQPPNQPQHKILTLASAQQPQPKNPHAMAIAVQAKKKALVAAGAAILKGAERLQKPTEKIADFHQELLLLRQHYR